MLADEPRDRTDAPGENDAVQPPPRAAIAVRPMEPADWPAVRAIYAAGIAAGNATFETEAPPWTQFDSSRLPAHRWVAAAPDGAVIGWIAASRVSARPAYAGVVEHSVYVDPAHTRHGVGRALLGAFINSTESAGIWTIQSALFPANTASIELHRSCGFRTVGTRERIAQHRGVWCDTILIERRSGVV